MKVRENVDYTSRDYESFKKDMLTRLQQLIPEYTDTSESDAGIVLLELFAHGLDIVSYYNDKVANEVFLPTARERDSVLMIAQNILGYEVQENMPSKVYQVFEILKTNTATLIPKGTLLRTLATYGETALYFETDEDLYIPALRTGLEKDEEGEYLYKVSCTQGYTVYDDTVGTSNLEADQVFTLSRSGVIKDSIKIYVVGESGVKEEWTRVSNFIDSTPTSKHFTVTLDDDNVAYVMFGNGKSGKIPYNLDNGITATYRIGGGTVGNVAPKVICRTDDNLAYIVNTFNPAQPYQLGVDRETLAEIKVNAPSNFKTKWSCITLQDYADVLKGENYVLDAKAVNTLGDPLNITVYVLPKNYEDMNIDTLRQLRSQLQAIYLSKKALGVTVTIAWAELIPVTLDLQVVVDSVTSKEHIKQTLTNVYLNNYSVANRKLGENLYISHMICDALHVDGVEDAHGKLSEMPTDLEGKVLYIDKVNLQITGGVS